MKKLKALAGTPSKVRRWLFIYEVLVLIALLSVAYVYIKTNAFHGGIPRTLQGPILYCAWFGALGAVTISLKGIYDHPPLNEKGEGNWGGKWPLWYIGRPFSGIVAGLMTLVLFTAVSSGHPTTAVVEAAAFILGLQERRFFMFLSEVAKVIVAVPKDKNE